MHYLYTSLLTLLLCTSAHAQNPTPAPEQSQPILITNATIHVGNGTVIENGSILFEDGRITQVGQNVGPDLVGTDAKQVDGAGKHVYPGLFALNSQLGLVEIDAVRATNDQREVGVVNPNARALIAFNTDSQVIPTVRSRGVLLAQATPEGGLVSGRSSVMQLDGWNFEDAGVGIDDGVHVNWPRRNSYDWQTGRLIENKKYEELVTALKSFLLEAAAYCGADRQGDRLTKLEAMCDAMSQTKNVYLHADEARDIQEGVTLLKKMGAKPVIVGGYQAYRVADFLKKEDVAVILSSTQALPNNQDDAIDQPFRNPALLAAAGVTFALSHEGTWQQRNIPFIAGQAVAFGLDYEAAITALTLTPAQITGVADRYGSLENGKSATLIVVSGDVLDMRTSEVEMAFIDGRMVDLSNKQSELAEKFREKFSRGR
ncbi:amidohydrolase family protein [Neolewinella antarctica]|uniref:Imidazolonepropionase-like amidohydrolase n=1 Tax=Neolewinella antarctica TaxID=442734 RepID=A0ABX0XGN5_9BACT|nr:amidohydrolase family protein [Neolewinella antarctica]NJC28357.1 imidazolonepropionase-like amidohydrolase [Neolewinella antarctica]